VVVNSLAPDATSISDLGLFRLLADGNDVFTTRHAQITALAERYAIPAVYPWREFVTAGGFFTCAFNAAPAAHGPGRNSMDAWDLVMRALSHYWRVTWQDNVVAQALLEKAIAIDPNYGQALGVLAASYTFSAHMGWADIATVGPIAERAALTAIMADSEDPWAHLALGGVYLFARRFDDTLAELELALRLNPNFSLAQGYYGLALSYCGRWEEGDSAARRALRLSPRDPLSALYYGIAAYAQFLSRNYDEAMWLAREGIRQRGDFVGAHRVLTAAAGMAGPDDVATAQLQELRRAQPNISLAWIAKYMPIKQDADREHYLEGFRRAGLD
jgi:tetratricopeptide (TPR) repeat protein